MENNTLALRLFDMLKLREGKKANIFEDRPHRVILGLYEASDWSHRIDSDHVPFIEITNEQLFDNTKGNQGTSIIYLWIHKIQLLNGEFVAKTINCQKCWNSPKHRQEPYQSDHEINCNTCLDFHYITPDHQELFDLGFKEVMIGNEYHLIKSHRLGINEYAINLKREGNLFTCLFDFGNGTHGKSNAKDIILFLKTNPETIQ